MRILKYRGFCRWARVQRLCDRQLIRVVEEIEQGLIDAHLGYGLYKKRIAKAGMGKRGGFRALLAFRQGQRVIFLFGFAKNEQETINDTQLILFRRLAKYYLRLSEQNIDRLMEEGTLVEVKKNECKKTTNDK